MHTHLWRLAIITLLAMFISPIYLGNSTSAAPLDTQTAAQHSGMRVIKASYVGASQPLRSITPIAQAPNAPSALRRLQDRLMMPKTQKTSNGGLDVSIVQDRPVSMSMPAPIAFFEGANNVNGVLPPDTQGDIGYDPATFSENFETWPLTGWTIVDNITGGGLTWDSSTAYGDGNYTGGAGMAADVNSDANFGVEYDTELVTPVINAATLANLNLVYEANFQAIAAGSGALDLDISNDSGTTWTNISHWVEDHGKFYDTPGETASVDLTPYAGPNFQLRWHYYTPASDPWDWYAQVDEVAIGVTPVTETYIFLPVINR